MSRDHRVWGRRDRKKRDGNFFEVEGIRTRGPALSCDNVCSVCLDSFVSLRLLIFCFYCFYCFFSVSSCLYSFFLLYQVHNITEFNTKQLLVTMADFHYSMIVSWCDYKAFLIGNRMATSSDGSPSTENEWSGCASGGLILDLM